MYDPYTVTYDGVTRETNLANEIKDIMDHFIKEMIDFSKVKFKLSKDFHEVLSAYTIYDSQKWACDPQIMKKTLLHFLCSGIPIQLSGFINRFGGSHAFVAMGITRDGKIRIKNSHDGANEEPLSIGSFCATGGIHRAVVYYMNKVDDKPNPLKVPGSALTSVFPPNPDGFYPFEDIAVTTVPEDPNSNTKHPNSEDDSPFNKLKKFYHWVTN